MFKVKRRFLIGVLSIGFFLFVFIIFAEISLRFRELNYYRKKMQYDRELFLVSPFLQLKPRPSSEMVVNQDSFRGEPLDLNPNTFLIFTFGGSTMFSQELPYAETFPAKLQAKLRVRYPHLHIQVQNAACDWYTTQHSLIRYLFKVRHYQPELIIVKHGINDLVRGFVSQAWVNPEQSYEPDYTHFYEAHVQLIRETTYFSPFSQSLLWERLNKQLNRNSDLLGRNPHMRDYGEYAKRIPKEIKVHEFRSLQSFRNNLNLFADALHLNAAKGIFLTEPSIYRKGLSSEEKSSLFFGPFFMVENDHYPDVESLEYGMKLFSETVKEVANKRDIEMVDVAEHTPKDLVHFFDDVHTKEPALEIEAELVFKKIVEMRLLDNWNPPNK